MTKRQVKKESQTGVCRLCLEHKTLCKSHVIPEFEYRPLYDEKHRMTVFHEINGTSYIQKGYYEFLLCLDCEKNINQSYESFYAKFASNQLPDRLKSNTKVFIKKGVDYKRIKLYILSVFWRILIAQNEPFGHIRSDFHAEGIRKIIFENQLIDENDYPLYGFLLIDKNDGNIFSQVITTPRMVGIKGVPAITVVFGGIKWLLLLSTGIKRPPPSIKKNGLFTLTVKQFWEIAEMKRFMRQVKNLDQQIKM